MEEAALVSIVFTPALVLLLGFDVETLFALFSIVGAVESTEDAAEVAACAFNFCDSDRTDITALVGAKFVAFAVNCK